MLFFRDAAATWHSPEVEFLQPQILGFQMKAEASVILNAMGALHQFYADHLKETIRRYFGDFEPPQQFLAQAEDLLQRERDRVGQIAVGKTAVR